LYAGVPGPYPIKGGGEKEGKEGDQPPMVPRRPSGGDKKGRAFLGIKNSIEK